MFGIGRWLCDQRNELSESVETSIQDVVAILLSYWLVLLSIQL